MYGGHWCLKTLKRSDEEQIIHQDELLFTSNEPKAPVSTLKIASARVLDVQQHVNFVLFSNRNLFAKLFPHIVPFGYGHPGTERKVNVSFGQCVKHYLCLSSRKFPQYDTFP